MQFDRPIKVKCGISFGSDQFKPENLKYVKDSGADCITASGIPAFIDAARNLNSQFQYFTQIVV